MKNEKITEAIVRLDNLGNGMYSKFGTESYIERCELHDIKDLLKQVNGDSTSHDQALNLAGVMPRFSKEDVIMLLEKRRKDAFDNDFHKYENTKLQRAIDAILQLMPPEYFPNGA